MDIRGPCKVLFHNGKECVLYELAVTEKTLSGYHNTLYYFENESDAEIYLYYLYQIDGKDFIGRVLRSKKIPMYEKNDFKKLLATLDFSVLENKVKDMKFTVERNFTPRRKQK